MSSSSGTPDLKQVVGALIFGASKPLTVKELRKCLAEVARAEGGEAAAFEKATDGDVRAALDALTEDAEKTGSGFLLREVAGTFRFQTDPRCGKWLRHLLDIGPGTRLSHPALETLAIIGYRQPITRAQIESVRGVNVDHVMRTLLEMQLIRIVGRSDLPGHPFLYGTTRLFLEHFGLASLEDLSKLEPMLAEQFLRKAARKEPGAGTEAGPDQEADKAADETGDSAPGPTKPPEESERADDEHGEDDQDDEDEDEDEDDDEEDEGEEDEA